MYYQTTDLSPKQLSSGNVMAKNQDQVIYDLMKCGEEWNCWKIKKFVPFEITSIRRSLHTLNGQGKIEFIKDIPGEKGRPVGSYRVVKELKLF